MFHSPADGFYVALHHHLDIPVFRQFGFAISPGTLTRVAVTPVFHTTTETAKTRFRPSERGCYFQSEIELNHWPYEFKDTINPGERGEGGRYSMTNCLMEAVLQVGFHSYTFHVTS